VLAGLPLVGEIHVHGLGSVAQDLVEFEGFGLTILGSSFLDRTTWWVTDDAGSLAPLDEQHILFMGQPSPNFLVHAFIYVVRE
jgi:hypothetical protein